MQGQRNTIQPIPENFDLGNMSDQNNMNIESHIYQDDRINIMAAPNGPDYQVSGNGSNSNFRNMGSHTSSNSFVNRWASGSASDSENAAGQSCSVEDKMSVGWNSVSNMQSTSMVDGRQLLDTNILSSENGTMNILNNSLMDDCLHLHPSCSYGPTSDANSLNFIANQTPVGSFMDPSSFPHSTVLVGPEPEQMTFAGNSGVACLAESSNGRANRIMEGRRVFCKRKTAENNPGPSLDPNPSSQWDEANLRFTIPGRPNMGNSLSISVPVATATLPDERPLEEPVITRPGAGLNDVTSDYRCGFPVAGQPDGSQRNVRLRFNSHHPEANFPQIWPLGNAGRALPELQAHSSHSRHVLSGNLSADTGSAGAGSVGPLRQPNMFRSSSSIPRSVHSLGRNDNSSLPRAGNPMAGAVREASSSMPEETSSRNIRMGNTNNAWLAAGTETRPANHDSGSWTPINRNTNEPRNHTSMLHPSPVVPWDPQHVPLTQALRRSAGGVQGSGSSSVSRSSQSGHIHPSRSVNFSSSSENLLPPRAGSQGQQYLRSALLMERQSDGIVGVPFGSLQAFTAEGDGRHRLMSEIRNVLELMRRGETLRFEDILILDQSAFYNAADIHDQHRDMRLDVDNMTYEELLALEERIGNVSTGLTEETVCKSLKKILYISGTESIAVESSKKQPEDELCSICREEYMDKDELGIIDCGHIHHSHCIKKWLQLKNLCPICKKTALNT